MDWTEFETILKRLISDDERPVVVYSGVYPIAAALPGPRERIPQIVLEILLKVVGPHRTLFMPTFTTGFTDGLINLDDEPGRNGMINELMRLMPEACRTASAFFSHVGVGPQAREAEMLRPADAWGDGSLYEWFERYDVHFLMLGVPRTMCSFLHRLEWLRKDYIPYRYLKTFQGKMLYRGCKSELNERLFVRNLDVGVMNDWEPYVGLLERSGMRSIPLGRGFVAEMGAKAMIEALMPVVTSDPFAFVKDSGRLRAHFVSARASAGSPAL